MKVVGGGNYFIGLDCGTESVGWAVTDENYDLLRRRGKTLWGVRLFDEASTAAERRANRSTRRRLARAKRRIKLLQMLFSEEIAKVDPDFYIRLRESLYLEEDKRGFSSELARSKNTLFNDSDYSDADYHREYPTIWHLRKSIIDAANDDSKHFDIRLYYLAIEHIIKHRGHFLRDGKISSGAGDFNELWSNLCDAAEVVGISVKPDYDSQAVSILKQKVSKNDKKNRLASEMFVGDANKDQKLLAHMLCGSSVNLTKLFAIEADDKKSLSFDDGNFEDKYLDISEFIADMDGADDLILAAKAIYDYVYLSDLLSGSDSISYAMVRNYDNHKRDLEEIKKALKPYRDDYRYFFNTTVASSDKDVFYNAYIGKGSTAKNKFFNVDQVTINKKLAELLKKHDIDGDLLARAEEGALLPKQHGYAKGTIPQQLHHNELELILKKLVADYPSFGDENPSESEVYNTKAKKIACIHEFRIPYYCGPMLSAANSSEARSTFSWADEVKQIVYPWNYGELVDQGKLAGRFIDRMKNQCTYIVGATTLPKNSLLYQKYMVLNELNNLKVNGSRIDNQTKQDLFNRAYLGGELGGNVTLKRLEAYMKSVGMINHDDELGGTAEMKTLPKLSTHGDFYRILGSDYNKKYNQDDLEKTIDLITILNNEPKMLARKIKQTLNCSDDEATKLSRLKYKDWGNFSKEFLCGIRANVNGQTMTILEALWETPNNLMELLGNAYGFGDEIKRKNANEVVSDSQITYDDVQDLYCSPAVKRTVWQTIKIIDELRKVMGHDPAKIFIEVTRGNKNGEKRVKLARRNDLIGKYKAIKNGQDEVANLLASLNSREDRDLQQKKMFLYYRKWASVPILVSLSI